jgi:hypothetical protein
LILVGTFGGLIDETGEIARSVLFVRLSRLIEDGSGDTLRLIGVKLDRLTISGDFNGDKLVDDEDGESDLIGSLDFTGFEVVE